MTGATKTYPRGAFRLTNTDPAFTFAADDSAKAPRFRMLVATGQRIPSHWMFENLYIDLAGIEIDSQKQPALEEHGVRVGYTDSVKLTDEGLVAEGVLLTTGPAVQLAKDAREGFPFRCSAALPPVGAMEEVPAGGTAEVNGETVTGPAAIWRHTRLDEVTFTATPADRATSAQIFKGDSQTLEVAYFTGEPDMADETDRDTDQSADTEDMTAEQLAEQFPELVGAAAAIVAEQASDSEEKEEEDDTADGDAADPDEEEEEEMSATINAPDPAAMAADVGRITKFATPTQPVLLSEVLVEFTSGAIDVAGAYELLNNDPKRNATTVDELSAAAPDALHAHEGATRNQADGDVDQAAAKFAASPELQKEFPDADNYKHYLEGVSSGAIL